MTCRARIRNEKLLEQPGWPVLYSGKLLVFFHHDAVHAILKGYGDRNLEIVGLMIPTVRSKFGYPLPKGYHFRGPDEVQRLPAPRHRGESAEKQP